MSANRPRARNGLTPQERADLEQALAARRITYRQDGAPRTPPLPVCGEDGCRIPEPCWRHALARNRMLRNAQHKRRSLRMVFGRNP